MASRLKVFTNIQRDMMIVFECTPLLSLSSQKITMIFIMISGALSCGYVAGMFTAMLANADATRAAFTERKENIKLFLKVSLVLV